MQRLFFSLFLFFIALANNLATELNKTKCKSLNQNLPKVEMNLLSQSNRVTTLESNKFLVTVEMHCSFTKPITWEFDFDPYVFHWTDSFWILSERSIQDFYNPSSYTYKAILNLRLHNPPVPQLFRCQQISDECTKSKVIANYSDSRNDTIKIQSESQLMNKLDTSISNIAKESECKIIYTIKQLSGTKIQWKCEGVDGTQVKMKYRQNWYCTTASQCRNYYSKAKMRATCTRILKADEPCSGCLISSDVSTMVMLCKIGDEHWTQPLFFPLDEPIGFPKYYYYSNDEIVRKMVKLEEIPPNLFLGDELKIVCSASEYFFAAPVIFALKYIHRDKLEFIISKTNFSFVSGTEQTYANFYEDEFNGKYDRSRNIRTYTHKINITGEYSQLEKVYCFAPVWNSTNWVNKSRVVKINKGVRPSGCHLHTEGIPKITILPGTKAIYSTPSLLIAENTDEMSVHLNCTSLRPVKWSFSFGDDYKENIGISTRKNDKDFYHSAMKLSFKNLQPSFKISCETLENRCLRNSVKGTIQPHRNILSVLPYSDPSTASLRSNLCFAKFVVKINKYSSFKWKAVDFNHQEEKMNAVSQILCSDFLSCHPFFQEEIQLNNNCLKVLDDHESCSDCDTFSTDTVRFPTGYLKAEHRNSVAYQPFFYSITSSSGERKLRFNWHDVDPLEMIVFPKIRNVFYTGEILKLTCLLSPYYFHRGFLFVLHFRNNSFIHINENDRNTLHDKVNEVYNLTISLQLTVDHVLLKSITCKAPPATSQKWIITSAQNVSVHESSTPTFLTPSSESTISFLKGQSEKSIVCKAAGIPEPKVSWRISSEKLDEGFTEDIEGNVSVLKFPKLETGHSGIYICEATNVAGTSEMKFQVEISEGASYTAIIIGVSATVILALLVAILAQMYVRFRRIQQTLDVLADEDIRAFREGGAFVFIGSIENDNDPIYSTPFDPFYEVPFDDFKIDKSQFLGKGAYGSVFKGQYKMDGINCFVAVKTVDPAVDIMYFKALLSEVKVMAYIGKHEDILAFIGASTQNIRNKEVYILTELCHNGNLLNFLKRNRDLFKINTEDTALQTQISSNKFSNVHFYDNVHQTIVNKSYENVFNEYDVSLLNMWSFQIARGMEYLEDKKVIHGDLAARNILLTAEHNAKISDFGLSRQLVDYSTYVKTTKCPLPWRWMALESLKDMKFSTKSDVWSFGITLWEIYSLGEVPYPGWSLTNEYIDCLTKGLRMQQPVFASDKLYKLLIHCWDKVPSNRPSFQKLRENLQNSEIHN